MIDRRLLRIQGIVQGVGFRPFVYRIARERQLAGRVFNDSAGVQIEIEGEVVALDDFVDALQQELPPLASISDLQICSAPLTGETGFRIVESQVHSGRTAQIAPDCHVCADCLRELFDPADRRFRYPFINCTNCGPRYTIVTDIPYDRPLTTMADFPMCPACQAEYDDPASRRFHAQPNACPDCGPELSLYDGDGKLLTNPLAESVRRLQQGEILAIKGLGGYHLAVDAANDAAVRRLRQRKLRDEKPFALMCFDLQHAQRYVRISAGEERLLTAVERPIVLLEQRLGHGLSKAIAPRNRFFGIMLPYTPVHYLLLEEFSALVMTSGNQSDEPIAFENSEAVERLAGIADASLQHNRRIHIRTDDSIARLLDGAPVLYRRSRGYVPRGIKLPAAQPAVLALGAELKNTLCLTSGDRAYLSHHIGDLKNQQVVDSLRQAAAHLRGVFEITPQLIAHDLHPDLLSTHLAEELATGRERIAVQHHHAHLVSCLADNGESGPAIGVIFDGIGYGSDGRIWGGEFLLGDATGFRREGQLAYCPMPGGDAATKQPWRMALSYLQTTFGDDIPELQVIEQIPAGDRRLLLQMIEKQINAPLTSSVGRLFDAVSALCGLRTKVSYEGQAALELEMCIDPARAGEETGYPFAIERGATCLQVDPRPMIRALVADLQAQVEPAVLSARFHNGLAQAILSVCQLIRARMGGLPVALSGGVFQNRYLTERSALLLRQAGFRVLLHRQVPPNDGGLSLGQAVIAAAVEKR